MSKARDDAKRAAADADAVANDLRAKNRNLIQAHRALDARELELEEKERLASRRASSTLTRGERTEWSRLEQTGTPLEIAGADLPGVLNTWRRDPRATSPA